MRTKTVEPAYRLSPMQQGMLLHSLRSRQRGVDIEQVLCKLPEDLDAPKFQRAWEQVIERHAILRTSFHWEKLDEPQQRVHRRIKIHCEQIDWRGLPAHEQHRRLDAYLQAERRRGFELTVPLLMRLALIQNDEANYQFVWTFHHLLLDARAIALVLNDFFALYEALCADQEPELKSPRPYHDYIEWLHRQDWSHDESYWRQTLRGFTAPTPLVVTKTPDRVTSDMEACAEQEIHLSEEVTSTLKSVAQQNHLTLNTLVQGAWALLLSRYSDEEDVVFGAIRACRRSTVEGAEAMVGLLINTVPMRVRVLPEMPLVPWLKTLREQWVALRDYEHTPLVKVQEWSEVPSGQPLFETIFNFQDPSWDAALKAQGGKWAKREFSIRSQPGYPLAVDAYAGPPLMFKMLYDRRCFDDATVRRMLGHFRVLLEGMAADPAQRLSALAMLTELERHQLLVQWNDTCADFPQDKCVHQLFEEQTSRTPDALAVASDKQRLSFHELNTRANVLAHEMETLGVGPDIRVGVCMERSAEMLIAYLAVLKAGGAYVPLDPAYPAERLAFMMADATMPVLLTQESLRAKFKFEISNLKLLCVDARERKAKGGKPMAAGNPVRGATSKNLAYVIYTSGSTGTPKGVEIEHSGLANLIAWHQRVYQVAPADRATQLASPAFDASVWELWPYLTAGASIHLPDEETRLSPKKLLAWLAKNQITLTFLPTPLAEAVMQEQWPEGIVLRALLTGGDKLRRRPPESLACPLVNHYGPTENTVVTTWTAVAPEAGSAAAPPIGRPIANTQVYVLDRHLQPVPIGVPGELFIGGVGLARDYLNRPDLTAEKFTRHPFSEDPNARLYRTGDRVRWSPQGNLEFLGRFDHQIKLRGHRIELGEIELALAQQPAVRQALAMVREDAPGDQRLVAYVVSDAGTVSPSADLRRHLQAKLPDHMVPSAFVFLDALPLSRNGKVDHKALPPPKLKREPDETFVTPRTPTEELLAGIWAGLLGLQQVGAHDNFFELGGHSLMATQVMSRVRRALAVELPLRDLFEAPTVADLARRIDRAGGQTVANAPLSAGLFRSGQPPLSFAQERLWFLEQLEPGWPFNNIPIALHLEGELNVPALEQALTEIVRRHTTLRTIFTSANGQPVATTAPARSCTVSVTDLSQLPENQREAEAQRQIVEEARWPFDLTQSPLLRARLLRLKERDHRLVLTMHHIASDGWSLGVFYEELAALYEAFSHGRSPSVPELPIDYADFAHWQRECLQGETLEQQLAYWKQHLTGHLPMLNLPTDRPRPATQTYRGATTHFALPGVLSDALRKLSREEEVTLFMVLLAAFQTLLHRHSGQDDILVGSPIAGRTRVETEALIGFFLNTLVFRGDLSGDPTFRELLQRVRKIALDAYAHQDLPFEKLVDALQPERDLSRSPLFQVMFVLQNEPLAPLALAGLRLTPLPVHSGTAKFDLMLSLEESDDGLSGFIEFNTDLFDANTIARLLGHFQTLLEGIVTRPEQRLSQLPLLTDAERQQLLIEWNDTRTEYPLDKCIHELFEEQVARTPDAVAIVFDDRQMNYRGLNQAADQLAHQLRQVGVGPNVLVGLCVERSLEMMVGLLSILKAGGAYVPLDPTYPQERLAFMLQDCGAPVLLVQNSLRSDFIPANAGETLPTSHFRIVCLASPPHPPHVPPLQTAPGPDDLAYVIYTSGSTGKPKGVMITQRNVVNFFGGMDRVLGTAPGVWLAVTSISFDISVLELFWTLTRGFKVVIQPEEEKLRTPAAGGGKSNDTSGQRLSVSEQIVRHRVSHLQCTPSLARALLLAPESHQAMRSLSKLLLGGEALPVALAEQLRKRVPGVLYNMYGPTETTVWSAVCRVEQIGNSIPIGRPIANTQIYILDRHLKPVPIGVPGEIFIGGEGVARSYLNRPELTTERFLPDPFSARSGTRLYRTGDLARWVPDGQIEFLGRMDNQVKIRGHRIELGEIESVVASHPAVREAVIVAREDVPGDRRLAAYVVAARNRATPNELRRFLRERLPEPMVPASFVFLDALPLTPNGKVNRQALPAPDEHRPDLETAYVAPGTDLEKTIAKIWRELLRVEKVGLQDNFFDLGGHSLLVVQAQARLREALGVDLPVIKLFQYPTVHSLSRFLGEARPEELSLRRIRNRARCQKEALARRARPIREVAA